MKPSQLKRSFTWCIINNRAVIVSGAPGGGKTRIGAETTKSMLWTWEEHGAKPDGKPLDLIIFHPVTSEPSEFRGQPWVISLNGNIKESTATHLPYDDLRLLMTSTRPIVCIFDDLGNALQSVQSALTHVVFARHIGQFSVSPFVRFIILTNRKEDKCASIPMIESLKTRCKSLTLETDLQDVIDYAVEKAWHPMWVAFMRKTPKLLDDWRASNDNRVQVTPRGCEFASDMLKVGVDDDIKPEMLAGDVGEAVTSQYLAFELLYSKLVSVEEIVDHPETAPIPENSSELYVTVITLAYYTKAANIDAVMKYATRLDREYAMLMIQDFTRRDVKLAEAKSVTNWFGEKRTQKMAGLRV